MTPPLVSNEDLSAYVDGALPVERQAEIAAWLAANKEAAETVSAYRTQAKSLREALDPILREPVPGRLLNAGRPRPVLRWAAGIAASLILVAAGAAGGWYAALSTVPPPVVAQPVPSLGARAAQAHAVYAPEVRHPVEVTADEQAHMQAWLTKRVGVRVRAPALTSVGFELVGGRLLPDPAGPAAQLMYQDGQGRRITLYVTVDEGHQRETAFRWSTEGSVIVCFWVDGPASYALAGEFDKRDLYKVAKTIYQQING